MNNFICYENKQNIRKEFVQKHMFTLMDSPSTITSFKLISPAYLQVSDEKSTDYKNICCNFKSRLVGWLNGKKKDAAIFIHGV